ncbi:alpha/beta hydrolase [Bradyrhizobium sp. SRS-191]|uniref:alpha/beta hydrolase n=1 Tax=Bradyrhizobium sp. SRS-191 TaxID=2962606 RepID=UPI00211EFA39|nr:alpha/beta hydrolase [Bradyrhizobium sp. SRS-191]
MPSAPRPSIAMRAHAMALLAAALAGLALGIIGIWRLEAVRAGLTITQGQVGTTPITIYQRRDAPPAPVVVIAHGFAGSRQFMEAYALTLAQAGYLAVSFDFEGHGRNPTPMSGDVTRIDGTTRKLMSELGRVTNAALSLPGSDGRVALLGHSMASDIIVREALADARIAATVAISMFSEAVTASAPRNLLIITGEWESALRRDALRNLKLADASANEGDTVGDPAATGARRAVVAPGVEHVSVLYSTTALREAHAWLDQVFGRTSSREVAATGSAIALLLAGIVLLAWPLAELLPKGDTPLPVLPLRTLAIATLAPAVLTPITLRFVDTRFLPVLVADYLAVHLFVYGALSLLLLRLQGVRFGRMAWLAAVVLAADGIIVFGGALDRYVASFMPIPARLPIIAAIAVGAVPAMLADSIANQGGHAALWRTLWIRGVFLASLGGAVALDLRRLFFLLIIIPVIVLFFIVFGLIGGCVGRRTCSPMAEGLGLGLILAWALGVTFPMFLPG